MRDAHPSLQRGNTGTLYCWWSRQRHAGGTHRWFRAHTYLSRKIPPKKLKTKTNKLRHHLSTSFTHHFHRAVYAKRVRRRTQG